MKLFLSLSVMFPVLAGMMLVSCQHDPPDVSQIDPVCFQTQVMPVFQNSCGNCHSSTQGEGETDLSSYAAIMKFVEPFNAAKSQVYTAILGKNQSLMPPSGPLPENARTTIWLWIQQGAMETTCDSGNNPPGSGSGSTLTCFTRDILPVMLNSCAMAGCHSGTAPKEGLLLTSYQTLMSSNTISAGNPSGSKFYQSITAAAGSENVMPPPPYTKLPKAVTDSIYKWIQRGAKNEICAASCDTTGSITYTNQIQPVISTNCLSCHSGSSPGGGVLLTSYTEVTNVTKNGRLISAIKKLQGVPAMPPSSSLSTCDIRKFELWKNQNYLQ